MRASRRVTLVLILALAAVLAPVGTGTARAFDFSTKYPSVRVEPGQDAKLDLNLIAARRQRVDLAVVEAPPGWTVRLLGGGFEVGAVYTDPQTPPAVQMEVLVPGDAPPGPKRVVVRATSGGEAHDLVLNLEVAPVVAQAFELTAEFPELQGSSTDTFTFNLTVKNNSTQPASFNLTATGPQGWTVTARPGGSQQATTANVDAGGTTAVTVTVDPPDDARAGRYPVVVRAVGQGRTLESALTVVVIGKVSLDFSTTTQRLNAKGTAGRTTSIPVQLKNSGSAPIQNVTLSSTPPSGWDVTFDRPSVAEIAPGDTVTVRARVKPSGKAVAGDYIVTLSASGSGQTKSLDVRFTVQASTAWRFAGIAIVLAAVLALGWVYRRFGRR